MLIVLLLVFDDPEPAIVRIRDQYRHMLRCCSSLKSQGCLMFSLQPVPGPLLPPGPAQRAAGRGVALSPHPAPHDSSLQSCLVSRHKINIHHWTTINCGKFITWGTDLDIILCLLKQQKPNFRSIKILTLLPLFGGQMGRGDNLNACNFKSHNT